MLVLTVLTAMYIGFRSTVGLDRVETQSELTRICDSIETIEELLGNKVASMTQDGVKVVFYHKAATKRLRQLQWRKKSLRLQLWLNRWLFFRSG